MSGDDGRIPVTMYVGPADYAGKSVPIYDTPDIKVPFVRMGADFVRGRGIPVPPPLPVKVTLSIELDEADAEALAAANAIGALRRHGIELEAIEWVQS